MFRNNFFISGIPKAGKTTLFKRLIHELENRGYTVAGFISPDEQVHGTREGFYVTDIATGKTGMLAHVGQAGPRIGKYGLNIKSFESIAIPALKNFTKYDIVIIDEIGTMEMKSTKFQDLLTSILESRTMLIASLHNDYINTYQIYGRVYTLNEENYNQVYSSLRRHALEILGDRTGMKKRISKIKKEIGPKTKHRRAKKGTKVIKRAKKAMIKTKTKKRGSGLKEEVGILKSISRKLENILGKK